jgi:hypothetical protein
MGIGGTAMAALAGMLADGGHTVTGSDGNKVYPPMSDYLARLGITVMEGFKAENLDHKPDLVVVGNVVRASYPEAQALLASDLPYLSFPGLLGARFLADRRSIVVAGTHGKTTTTALTAWLLEAAGRNPGFLVGGVARNFDRIEGSELRWACDLDEGLLDRHRSAFPRTRFTTNLDEVLADPETDAVVIATPVPTHAALGEYGSRHARRVCPGLRACHPDPPGGAAPKEALSASSHGSTIASAYLKSA